MEESILTTIKKLLGLTSVYDAFDEDIITHINSVLFALCQLGIGPTTPFTITGATETWADFLGDSNRLFEPVKTYIYIRVKIIFDPPANSFTLDALKKEADMYEWRLNVMAETPTWEE